MCRYDAQYSRHPQTAPGKFGGIERLEDSLSGIIIHAAAVVSDFQADILSLV